MAHLNTYGRVYTKISIEGGFGVFDYGDPVKGVDQELSDSYKAAEDAMKKFKGLLESKIREHGGNPKEYEA